jgi:uncharacterized protein
MGGLKGVTGRISNETAINKPFSISELPRRREPRNSPFSGQIEASSLAKVLMKFSQWPIFAILIAMKSLANLRCLSCGKLFPADTTSPHMPFCSSRCKMADLNRWMSEDIGVPTGSSEPEDDPEEPTPPPPVREWRFD